MNKHQGVGVLIGNPKRTQFFIQQKDETYPIPKWRNCYSFWGGAIEEEDANALAAANREILEEIPAASPLLQPYSKEKIGVFNIPTAEAAFDLTVFELLIPNTTLQEVAAVEVFEGRGLLLDSETILESTWIWNMDFVFEDYMKNTK